MELRQIEYFVAVAEDLHFGRAAERLHIGQPAVSQQLRRLERELGADLFDRSPRHVRLTAAGASLLPEAREVLAAVARARAAVAAVPARRASILRIGTSTGLGEHLERLLDELARLAPDVGVELTAAPVADRLDQVADGQLDAAFVRGPVQDDGRGLRAVALWRDPLVAALPARHSLASRNYVTFADLAALPLRLTSRGANPALVDLVVSAFHEAGCEPTSGGPTTTLTDTLAAIGADASSWTVVYAAHAALLRTTRIAFVPFAAPGLALTTHLVTRRDPATPHFSLLMQASEGADPDSDPDSDSDSDSDSDPASDDQDP
jgi:DNA-binding transcriptional LysR family regulator